MGGRKCRTLKREKKRASTVMSPLVHQSNPSTGRKVDYFRPLTSSCVLYPLYSARKDLTNQVEHPRHKRLKTEVLLWIRLRIAPRWLVRKLRTPPSLFYFQVMPYKWFASFSRSPKVQCINSRWRYCLVMPLSKLGSLCHREYDN